MGHEVQRKSTNTEKAARHFKEADEDRHKPVLVDEPRRAAGP